MNETERWGRTPENLSPDRSRPKGSVTRRSRGKERDHGKKLFRKQSMDRISSPEELHDYIQVTGPRLWMVLTAIAVLLAGLVVYASTVTMENTMDVTVTVDNCIDENEEPGDASFTIVTCMLDPAQKDLVNTGMKVRVAGQTGEIASMFVNGDQLGIVIDMEKSYLGLPDGEYPAQIVLENITPISFLLN